MNDNQDPALTAAEIGALELTMAQRIILRTAVEDGVVRVPFHDPQFDEKQEVTSLLIQMGLLKMNSNHDVIPTDSGRAALAASQRPSRRDGAMPLAAGGGGFD